MIFWNAQVNSPVFFRACKCQSEIKSFKTYAAAQRGTDPSCRKCTPTPPAMQFYIDNGRYITAEEIIEAGRK